MLKMYFAALDQRSMPQPKALDDHGLNKIFAGVCHDEDSSD